MVRCNLILSYNNVEHHCVNDRGCHASVGNDSPPVLFTQQVPKDGLWRAQVSSGALCSASRVALKEWRWVSPPEDGFINRCIETMSKSKLVPTHAFPTTQLKFSLGVPLNIRSLKFSTA